MIEPDGALSVSRKCALLDVSRSSLYYRPKGESAENLALMRRMDSNFVVSGETSTVAGCGDSGSVPLPQATSRSNAIATTLFGSSPF